jgi:hypothetical protein
MNRNSTFGWVVGLVVGIAMVSVAQSQTTIAKVKPITPVKPIPKVCDPNAWGDYLRKKRVVEELLDNYFDRSKAARHTWVDELRSILGEANDQVKEHVETEHRVDQAEEAYKEYVESRYSRTEAALRAEQAEGLGGAVEAGGTAGLIAELALDAAMLRIAYKDYVDALAANDKDLQRIDPQWQSALADLRQALSQSETCKHDRDRADAEAALNEKARAKIEEWNIDGRPTYLGPNDNVPVDEQTALEEAKQILLSQHSGFLRPQRGFSFMYVQLGPPTSMTGAQRAAAALIRVQRAHGFFRMQMDGIIAFVRAEERFEQSIAEIRGAH